MSRTPSEIRYVAPTYASEEDALAAREEASELLDDLARAIARAVFKREWKELMETGRCRTMSLDPNVDWEKHDAEWAAYDAAKVQERHTKRK